MDAIKESITAMTEMFDARMCEFQQDLNKSASPTTITSLATDFSSFKKFIHTALTTLQKQVELLTRNVDRIDMCRRRKMLLFHGVEEKKTELIDSVVTNLVVNNLNVADFTTSNIKTAYRLGRSLGNKPRPIVVKFTSTHVRHSVWISKTKLKGSGITVSEFLTKNRHDVFMLARQRFGVGKCWTRDGSINVIASNGLRYRVECMSELQSIPVAPSRSPPPVVLDTASVPICSNNKISVQRCKRVVKK